MYTSSKDMNRWSDGQLMIAQRLSASVMQFQRGETMCVCVRIYTILYFHK